MGLLLLPARAIRFIRLRGAGSVRGARERHGRPPQDPDCALPVHDDRRLLRGDHVSPGGAIPTSNKPHEYPQNNQRVSSIRISHRIFVRIFRISQTLGDIPGLNDKFVTTEMGEVSFFQARGAHIGGASALKRAARSVQQLHACMHACMMFRMRRSGDAACSPYPQMCYYIFVTISTVGYGAGPAAAIGTATAITCARSPVSHTFPSCCFHSSVQASVNHLCTSRWISSIRIYENILRLLSFGRKGIEHVTPMLLCSPLEDHSACSMQQQPSRSLRCMCSSRLPAHPPFSPSFSSGDFTPKTVLGRGWVGVVIVGGVAFFSVETSELLNVSSMSASGLGSYFPTKGRPHCLLAGGAVVNGSAAFSEFLEEACHPARGAMAPDIVVMVPPGRDPDPKLHTLLKSKWVAERARFLMGSLLDPKDLLRARADAADMAVILADLTAADPQSEDEETVLSAVALHRAFPRLPLRVLLIGRDSIELGVTAGLPRSCLTAATHFGPRMLALSARCVGSATLIANMVRCSPRAPSKGRQPWHEEYLHGLSHQLYGGQLGSAADGVSFGDLAGRLFGSHGVILVGIFRSGKVLVNPGGTALHDREIVWCLAESEPAAAAALAAETGAAPSDWRAAYETLRRDAHVDEEEERVALVRKIHMIL